MFLQNLITKVTEQFSDSILDTTEFRGETVLHIKGECVLEVLEVLKSEGFHFLADLTAVDNLEMSGFERYTVVYHLLNHGKKERLVVKAYVPENNPNLSSVESLWKTADWQEREVYDLFGINFDGHPNLIRIMNPDDFKGHPLRKDYPRFGKGERKDFPIVERHIGTKIGRSES